MYSFTRKGFERELSIRNLSKHYRQELEAELYMRDHMEAAGIPVQFDKYFGGLTGHTAHLSSKFPGGNFMTPHVLGYIETPKYIIEMSSGRGFHNEGLFGVTVITNDGNRTEMSQCFPTFEEAIRYANGIE